VGRRNEYTSNSCDTAYVCVQLDLADLESVRKFVEDFRATGKQLSVLVNNAGICANFKDTRRQYSKDNFELTMATNHIGTS